MIKCKICSKPTEPFEAIKKQYYYCNNCKFIFLDKKFIVSTKKEKERYLKHENTIKNLGYVKIFKDFIKIIDQNNPRIKTALDFGCGPGDVLKTLLQNKDIKTDSYDIHFQKEKVYENNKYDLITCTEVVEHLKNPLEIIKLLRGHLSSNGIIAIMTLFHSDNKEDFQKWWYITDETHISFYTIKTFEKIAALLNLEISFTNSKNIVIISNKK
jgi:hypothetical protein